MKNLTTLGFMTLTLAVVQPLSGQNSVTIDGDLTDWVDEVTASDPDPCNDFPGQQDIKGAGIATDFAATDPNPATTAYFRFDFDELGVTGAGQSLDGCWLVDHNQNGFTDVSLCFSLNMSPSTVNLTRFFTCGDSAVSCAMPITEVFGTSATCAVAHPTTVAAGKLLECGAAEEDPEDSAVECSMLLVDMGWTSGVITLLQACSFNSAQPNSASQDCIIDPGSPPPWTINPDDGGNYTPVELMSFSVD